VIEIISFGYLHGPAPQAHATFDVRHHFKDPHVDPALRHLTAADAPVMRAVLGTPGIGELAAAITAAALAYLAGPQPGPAVIAIGCAGGRHRSAALAIEAARQLRDAGIPVTLTHRDITRPVISREASEPQPSQEEQAGRNPHEHQGRAGNPDRPRRSRA
jgi:UPF0042 nucleotide-binding protein